MRIYRFEVPEAGDTARIFGGAHINALTTGDERATVCDPPLEQPLEMGGHFHFRFFSHFRSLGLLPVEFTMPRYLSLSLIHI